MTKVPDAWEDEWSNSADKGPTPPTESTDSKRVSAKVTKAQRRAQQAEFNRQLWADAEGPKEPDYFLTTRGVVPLQSEYKQPTVLLSRKGPAIQARPPRPPTSFHSEGQATTAKAQESSEDEDEVKAKELTLAERQAQAAKDREEKQRKYDERRKELFGTSSLVSPVAQHQNRSGTSTPSSLTPPGSRSATPSRGRGGRGRRGGATGDHSTNPRNHSKHNSQQRDLFDPSYGPKPDSAYIQRRENGMGSQSSLSGPAQVPLQQPVRAPKGPDGSGRGGFGFTRGAHTTHTQNDIPPTDANMHSQTSVS